MDELNFDEESLDVIWSEGAIYNIGFEDGVRTWRRFLRVGGLLAVSEITWLTDPRPAELEDHWTWEYPEVATASTKLGVLEAPATPRSATFLFPSRAGWTTTTGRCRAASGRSSTATDTRLPSNEMVEAEQREIDLYDRYSAHVSYGFYIANRHCLPDSEAGRVTCPRSPVGARRLRWLSGR